MMSSSAARNMPRVLPGFESLGRFWDNEHQLCSTKLLPGEYYVTPHNEIITTVLGSCVSACIRDPQTGVGGMNHFMLPGGEGEKTGKWGGVDALATRFGGAAMERLINDILKHGARKPGLEIKLFGGGQMLNMSTNAVGERNIAFVRSFLRSEGLQIVSEDLGKEFPRKVLYFPSTGKVLVRRLRAIQKVSIAETESRYAKTIGNQTPATGDIELFD